VENSGRIDHAHRMPAQVSNREARRWRVLLLGGASGVGKTAVSYRLAQHFGIAICEVDDFHILLERLTTPVQQPAVHFFRAIPAADQLPAAEIFERALDVGRALAPGLEAVIANHLETDTPLVMEGDFIHPDLAAQRMFEREANGGRVCAVFLHEPDEQQILSNYLAREPAAGPQTKRAHVSWLTDRWLKQEAERHGWPVVPARPWATVLERLIEAVEAMDVR
jgi:2-phosphoglycerate kinase